MTALELCLNGFRNYDETLAAFSEGVNVIIGANAQGKTNMLEALYYLAVGRSFRTHRDQELIGIGRDSAKIACNVFMDGRSHLLEAELFNGRRRILTANGVRLKSGAELAGRLTAVLFSPDDLYLIRDGAAVRRRLIDLCLCQLRPRYAAALSEFTRLLNHKTRILKDHFEKPSLLETLDDFNRRICEVGAELIYRRAHFSRLLSEKAENIHRAFSGSAETLEIRYHTVKTIDDPLRKPAELLPMLLEHQRTHREAELRSGMNLSGAHKDDLEILIDGLPARQFASQGQARTAALSIKLAEREIHYSDRGEYPILLLDDVLSELDASRQDFILNHIQEGQVFITCCEDAQIAARTGGKLLQVSEGRLI